MNSSLQCLSNTWELSKYFLDENEIQLLRKIKMDSRIMPCSKIMEVDVGIVTGRNEFFMLTKDLVFKWNLKLHTTKVVSKSNHFKGIVYTDSDFETNFEENNPVLLFLPKNIIGISVFAYGC